MLWHLLWVTLVVVAANIYRNYRDNKDDNDISSEVDIQENNKITNTNMEATISTRQLALNTIENIGSKPEYDEDCRIRFEYQGVVFLMEAVNDCMYVNLIWPWCHSFSKFDVDEFSRVTKVINLLNGYTSASVFYSITDSDEVAVHIKKHFLLIPQIPDLELNLKLILDSFFRTVRTLDVEIEKCRLQECEKQY